MTAFPLFHLVVILSLVQVSPVHASDLKVFASNYPLAFFAEQISGNPDMILAPKTTGDPADWQPSIEDVLSIQQATVILINGAGYEPWVQTMTLPTSRIVDTSIGFKDHYLKVEGAVTHQHGPEGSHSHDTLASTTWMDLSLAAQQAFSVKEALVHAGIGEESSLQQNYGLLEKKLLVLDSKFRQTAKGLDRLPLVASHPVYDYMATRYHLNIKSVHWEPDRSPTEEMWSGLKHLLTVHPAAWMIWENNPQEESLQRLESMGVHSVVINPGGQKPDQGDFLSLMEANLANLKKISAETE